VKRCYKGTTAKEESFWPFSFTEKMVMKKGRVDWSMHFPEKHKEEPCKTKKVLKKT